MENNNMLLPNYNDGRFFVSPILGCKGACNYCYLKLNNYSSPKKNELPIKEIKNIAMNCKDFVYGKYGTIVSIGAWGDIFPREDNELIEYSICIIIEILKWGNPVQIMSKFFLEEKYIKLICKNIQYSGQLLYSTTITTLENWKVIEPNTDSPISRLETCRLFGDNNAKINVLLKPFVKQLTGKEIEKIADLLLDYKVDYCTLGIMYWDEKIKNRLYANEFLGNIFSEPTNRNHLDCNGNIELNSSDVEELLFYQEYLAGRGIKTFLKSSCVNANVLHINNPSKYFRDKSKFCIGCNNCK